jgi:hypothetical protein
LEITLKIKEKSISPENITYIISDPEKKVYEIENGLSDMKRNINLKLVMNLIAHFITLFIKGAIKCHNKYLITF